MTDPNLIRYVPTEQDKTWAKQMLEITTQGAILAFPGAKLVYRVEHNKHRLILLDYDQLEKSFDSFRTHEMTKDVFAAIGYDVIDIEDEI